MVERTTMPRQHWADLCNRPADFFFSTYEAKKWGLVDHIIEEKSG